MELTKEMLEKAKQANNAEELVTLAKENGVELTTEQAEILQKRLHMPEGEASEEDLAAVSAGGLCIPTVKCPMCSTSMNSTCVPPNNLYCTCPSCNYSYKI